MDKDRIEDGYFEWMYDIVCKNKYSSLISFKKLLMLLHTISYYPRRSQPHDANRADDGVRLRYRFGYDNGIPNPVIASALDILPCSIFEMMIALSIRCEESIMDDPSAGNRVGQWFWEMVVSLGLGKMDDEHLDKDYVYFVINEFEQGHYERNGKGGLFTIENCEYDLRNMEIWYQMCFYLDSIL